MRLKDKAAISGAASGIGKEEEQVEAGTASVIKAFGTLDVLGSNAGIQIVAPRG
jgi:hypothetical protein